tara:strand:+ start:304 stop:510 length:207 start_codon:yes stop_codon:yes gene_type:complete
MGFVLWAHLRAQQSVHDERRANAKGWVIHVPRPMSLRAARQTAQNKLGSLRTAAYFASIDLLSDLVNE